ncbi:DOPA-like domain-containing protein [Annulohypoxylon stygium]|nr:DOPA-like domain-containing protein [Annulohypoxylon stygium]
MSYKSGPYTYPSPLVGYENAPTLSDERKEDGKSFKNPAKDTLSKAYTEFPDPLDKGRRGGFDVHIYYLQSNEAQTKYAKELWERIRHEFPELRIYRVWDRPIGPHPVAMFEVNLFTPAQFGAFVAWLAIYRGPLSVLIHPNTTEGEGAEGNEVERRNHTQRAIWMGERYPLDLDRFY